MLAAEIPPDFMALKAADLGLARDWRFFAREFFETAFARGYIVTDFAFDPRATYAAQFVCSDRRGKHPGVGQMMRPHWFQRIIRKLDKTLASAFFLDQWVILTAPDMDFRSLDWRGLTPVVPPKDRYWGDPFVIHRVDRYYVFIEEKLYATGRGHIACLTLDAAWQATGPGRRT